MAVALMNAVPIIREEVNMMNKNVFHKLSYGVYIISTLDGERPTGCVANSVMQITSTPATFAVSMNHDNYTNRCIEQSGVFAISILHEQSDASLIGKFGFQSGRDCDKFEDVEALTREGLSIIPDACGYIVCRVIDKMETSTHTVFLGEAVAADVLKAESPMTYDYYHKVVKGKSPKNAPTYIEEEQQAGPKKEGRWVCSICGYEYKGEIPFEEVPDEFVCPLCKQPKSQFIFEG